MSVEHLIKDIKNYCKKYFPNVKKIEAKVISLDGDSGVIKNVKTRIVLNDKIEFDYFGGTSISDYDNYYKNA